MLFAEKMYYSVVISNYSVLSGIIRYYSVLSVTGNTGIKERAERNKKSSQNYQKKANMVRTKADAGGSSGSRKGIVFGNTIMQMYFCNSGQKIKKARTFNLLQGS